MSGSQQPGERRLYGRRRGHPLRARRAALMRDLLPQLAIPLKDDAIDPVALFTARGVPVRAARLEIGFGGGEHLIARARAAPQTGFLGVEPFENGMARLLADVETEGLDNILVHQGDGRDLLDRLADRSLEAVYLLYPDPWPKKRHRKRRLVTRETVRAFARVLKPGGRLEIASDIPGYIDWALERVLADGRFDWPAERAADWRTAFAGWPGTRYEAKAIRAGRVPHYLSFIRRG